MTEIVGYRLIDTSNNVIQTWGGTWGMCPGVPDLISLPNGDQVHCPVVGETYSDWTLTQWNANPGKDQVYGERDRRLSLGFNYTFSDSRGVQNIGTTPDDMVGWNEVTTWATIQSLTGNTTAKLSIQTNTGVIEVTPSEWFEVLGAAAAFRQPVWNQSFVLAAMDPIPDDYNNDSYWTS